MVRYLPLARTRERPRLICPRPADDVSMSPPPPPASTTIVLEADYGSPWYL